MDKRINNDYVIGTRSYDAFMQLSYLRRQLHRKIDKLNVPEVTERKIKFKGIDDWGRPVFTVLEENSDTIAKYYVGSTDKLFPHHAPPGEVVEYFKDRLQELVYFGAHFGCEPDGSPMRKDIKFVLT